MRKGRVRDACCNNTIKTASKRASRPIDLPQPCRGMEGLALLPLAGGARVRFFWSRVCVSESHPINSNGLRGLSNSSCVFFSPSSHSLFRYTTRGGPAAASLFSGAPAQSRSACSYPARAYLPVRTRTFDPSKSYAHGTCLLGDVRVTKKKERLLGVYPSCPNSKFGGVKHTYIAPVGAA